MTQDQQVRRLMSLIKRGLPLSTAAVKAGMSELTARNGGPAGMTMKLKWPPLGLGTAFNLASSSPSTRPLFRRSWWLIPVLGGVTPLLMLAIDQLIFGGISLRRVRALGAQPLWFRLLVVVYSGVTEELLYRLFLTTFVGWLGYLALARITVDPKTLAQWLGILAGALLFGLAHVGNLPDVSHPFIRAVTINGIAGVILGWLYWWRGLEMAILTHMVAILVLYIVVPPFI